MYYETNKAYGSSHDSTSSIRLTACLDLRSRM